MHHHCVRADLCPINVTHQESKLELDLSDQDPAYRDNHTDSVSAAVKNTALVAVRQKKAS